VKSVVVIGNFDGVHRGHQAVLGQAHAIARARSASCVVLTFDPHPMTVIGRGAPPRLVTTERRVELLVRHGADEVVVEPFTTELAAMTPEEFARDLLATRLEACAVVVGENFRFGHDRAGDFEALRALGETLGFEAVAAEVAGDERGAFSSTRVRDAIDRGDLKEAEHVLGRLHSLSGVVAPGDRLGRTIGFPTANLSGVEEMLPPHGVYAVLVDELPHTPLSPVTGVRAPSGDAPRALAKGVMNVGTRPTVGGAQLRIEAHLFDLDRDLYGARLRAHLVSRIREERRFAGLDDLKRQIAEDARRARDATKTVELRDDRAAFG
jgi:riboflavin kinase/FMN adenylyltransferase